MRAEGDGRGHVVLDVRGDVEIFADRVNVDVGIELDRHCVLQVDGDVAHPLAVVEDSDVGNGDCDVHNEHAVDQLDVGVKLRSRLENVDDSHAERALFKLAHDVVLDDDHALVRESGGRVNVEHLKHFGEVGLGISDSNVAADRLCRGAGFERSLRAVVILENEDLALFKTFVHAHQRQGASDNAIVIRLFFVQCGMLLFGVYDFDSVDKLNAADLLSHGELECLCVGVFFEICAVAKLNHNDARLGPAGLGRIEIDNVLIAPAGYRFVIADCALAGRRLDIHFKIGNSADNLEHLLSGKTVCVFDSAVNGGAAAASVVHTGVAGGTVTAAGGVGCAGIDRFFGPIVGTCHKHRQCHSKHENERYAKQKSVSPHNHFLRNRFQPHAHTSRIIVLLHDITTIDVIQ